jgi:hypothetical protein
MDTMWHRHGQNLPALLFCLGYPAVIVIFTFILEGIETSFTELRDKDRQQFEGDPASRILDYIRAMGEENFYDAREWAIIALLVWATLLMEQDAYYLPFMGVIGDNQTVAFEALRVALTIALTAFALVWVAQSPGKFVARKNSVEFLSYRTSLTLRILRFVWSILSGLGLQYPSQIADTLVLNVMSRCKSERALPPSDFSFFADSLKKYGYGYLISDDALEIQTNGSCRVVSRNLSYVGSPRYGVKKDFEFEEGYPEDMAESLRKLDSSKIKCWAFEVPPIGERVSVELLDDWAKLFYSTGDPGNWKPLHYKAGDQIPVCTTGFKLKVGDPRSVAASGGDPKHRALWNLEVELDFRQVFPKRPGRYEAPRVLLILWEIEIFTREGTVQIPQLWGDKTEYPYFKKRPYPCLRSTVTITLPSEAGLIFTDSDGTENYTVEYDGVVHQGETERFLEQYRAPLFGAPQRPKDLSLQDKFVFFNDSSLPAASYNVNVIIEKRSPE